MKIFFYTIVLVAAFAGVIAVRLRHKIKSKALRVFLSLLGALGIFALAGEELHKLTNGFETWNSLKSIGALVPLGWFLAGCFVLFYAFEGGVLANAATNRASRRNAATNSDWGTNDDSA